MPYAVLDASAIIALLRDEPGARAIESLLADTQTQCIVHAINLCEVFYDAVRDGGTASAFAILDDITDLGIVVSEDLAPPFWQLAGLIKSSFRASLADCFGLALAGWLKADFYASDHHELDAIAPLGICRIRFIR
jgi:PIN domain nuclease of toxin-antitoxin system